MPPRELDSRENTRVARRVDAVVTISVLTLYHDRAVEREEPVGEPLELEGPVHRHERPPPDDLMVHTHQSHHTLNASVGRENHRGDAPGPEINLPSAEGLESASRRGGGGDREPGWDCRCTPGW